MFFGYLAEKAVLDVTETNHTRGWMYLTAKYILVTYFLIIVLGKLQQQKKRCLRSVSRYSNLILQALRTFIGIEPKYESPYRGRSSLHSRDNLSLNRQLQLGFSVMPRVKFGHGSSETYSMVILKRAVVSEVDRYRSKYYRPEVQHVQSRRQFIGFPITTYFNKTDLFQRWIGGHQKFSVSGPTLHMS
jgi:hypothetical protein